MRRTLAATFALLAAGAAQADCPPATAAIAGTIAEAWAARATIAPPAVADDAAALCVQDALAAIMAGAAGAPVGWKVGLTSKAAQDSFGVDHPVAGRLFADMLLADGSVVPRAFGGRPIAEADMLVRVRDAAVMEATTPMEALVSLDAVIPFIELADLMVTPVEPMSADVITAINVGARAGVAGAPVPIEPTAAWLDALGTMTVRLEDGTGAELGTFPGADILGHPLNAVLWLAERLRATGESLGPGDLVSLGGFGPPLPPGELTALRLVYSGLPGGAEATVAMTFE